MILISCLFSVYRTVSGVNGPLVILDQVKVRLFRARCLVYNVPDVPQKVLLIDLMLVENDCIYTICFHVL